MILMISSVGNKRIEPSATFVQAFRSCLNVLIVVCIVGKIVKMLRNEGVSKCYLPFWPEFTKGRFNIWSWSKFYGVPKVSIVFLSIKLSLRWNEKENARVFSSLKYHFHLFSIWKRNFLVDNVTQFWQILLLLVNKKNMNKFNSIL